MSLHYYVIDTETNGLKPSYHEITQISIIRCSDRNQLSKYVQAHFPERSSKEALQVTGRTLQDLYQGEQREDVVDMIDSWMAEDEQEIESRCMIAHNASFDKNFCHALWASCGRKFPAVCWLDTKPFAKSWAIKLGIEKPKLSLTAALEFTGTKPVDGKAHNAITDSRNTFLLWKRGMAEGIDHLPCIKRYPHE